MSGEKVKNRDIADGVIRGIGKAAHYCEILFGRAPYENRVRSTEFMTIEGHPFKIRESDPHPEAVKGMSLADIPTIFHSLGWTEFVDAGTGEFLHDELAEAYPHCYVTTAETPGVTSHGYPLSLWEAFQNTPEKIVDAYWQIIRSIAGKAPVILVGESAGGANGVRLAKKNMDAPVQDRLDIASIHIVSGCIVASEVDEIDRFRDHGDKTHCIKTVPQFFGHMVVDIPRTAMRNPKDAWRCASSLGRAVVRRPVHMVRTLPAILGNLVHLLPGTSWQTINEVFSQHQVYIYVGSRDALREDKMYQKLKELFPDNVHIVVVPDEGHSMVIGAQAVAEGLSIAA